jgi:hypothetical protein
VQAHVTKKRDGPIKPTKIEGRCAFCRCGARIELPAPVRDSKGKRFHYLRCIECIEVLEVEDPWTPPSA